MTSEFISVLMLVQLPLPKRDLRLVITCLSEEVSMEAISEKERLVQTLTVCVLQTFLP